MRLIRNAMIALALVMSASPAAAIDYKMDFVRLQANADIRAMWTNELQQVRQADPAGELRLEFYGIQVPLDGGDFMTVTTIGSPVLCGVNTCPVKIFRNKVELANFPACSNISTHVYNPDKGIYTACGQVTYISD